MGDQVLYSLSFSLAFELLSDRLHIIAFGSFGLGLKVLQASGLGRLKNSRQVGGFVHPVKTVVGSHFGRCTTHFRANFRGWIGRFTGG